MSNYLVTWEIDIEADDPIQAAKEAFRIMQKEETTANFFVVLDKDTDISTNVDLMLESDLEDDIHAFAD